MSPHVDILEQPDRLARWLMGSIAMHVLIAGTLIWYNFIGPGKTFKIGSPNPGGLGGAVQVNAVTIPLPSNGGPQNPVANDTKTMAPVPPPVKAKPQPKTAPKPDANAIPMKTKVAKEKDRPKPSYSAPHKFREQQKDLPNQVYGHAQALSNPMYAVKGGGQLGVGENSPFGTQFGWYAERLIDQVGRHWNRGGLNTSNAASVTFTIHRDGSVTGIRLLQSSGNMGMDFSAQRAVIDASPFPPLPPGFPKSDATVELKFVLQ
jgi:protein TonB